MRITRAAAAFACFVIVAVSVSACGGDEREPESSLATQPASERSSLQEYLLTKSDFPSGTKWQHVNQADLQKQIAAKDQETPDDPVCAKYIEATSMKDAEPDAVVAVPKQMSMIMHIAVRPEFDMPTVRKAVTGRCASQTATTSEGKVRLTYTRVKTGVPGTLTVRLSTRSELSTQPVSVALIAYYNRGGVGATLLHMSITESAGTAPEPVDVADFTRTLTRAVELADAA